MELTIIIALALYIVILHYNLYSSRKQIEILMRELKSRKAPPHHQDWGEGLSTSPSKLDKILETATHRFLLEDEQSQYIFIHYTRTQYVAQRIIEEGFRFADTFHKTAEQITNDRIDLIYKHILHRSYGDFVVVMGIDRGVYQLYLEKISSIRRGITPEQVMVEVPPGVNDNGDEVYLLPRYFIKGYVNVESGEIVPNTYFNPKYNSPAFEENVKRLSRR